MPDNQAVIRYTIRLPVELHTALATLAKRERRSLHGEILRILEETVERDRRPDQTTKG
jgi:hypothetical protein